MQDVSIEDNIVLGKPAGSKAISVSKTRTELYASPPMEVWQSYSGPAVSSGPFTIADSAIDNQARPRVQFILDVRPPPRPFPHLQYWPGVLNCLFSFGMK